MFELWWEFTRNDFKLRYKKSILGILWVIIKPLALFFIIYNVWTGLNRTTEGTALSLLSAIMLNSLFAETVLFGLNSLLNKSHIILKINFPREVVVFAATFIALINYSLNVLVLAILGSIASHTLFIDFIPVALLIGIAVYIFGTGLSLFMSVLYVKFRDLIHLVEIILQILFWATPILYSVELLKDNPLLYNIVMFNPISYYMLAIKSLFNGTTFIYMNEIYMTIIVFLAILLIGYIFFQKNIKNLAEHY